MILHRLSPTVTLYHGDCRDALRRLPDNSVDAVPCDPPYELNFMGKGWDDTGIANDASFWAEVFRVLKPGGHLAAFSASRTYHRMACAIEDAGFEIRDSLLHVTDPDDPIVAFMESLSSEQLGAFMRCLDNSQFGGLLAWVYGTGFPKSQNVSAFLDKMAGAERHVVGFDAAKAAQQTAKQDTNSFGDYAGSSGVITAPVTPAAIEFDGFGTALKPAFEPIVLARKPLSESTVAANVLRWRCGALNIDGCRVGMEGATKRSHQTKTVGVDYGDGVGWTTGHDVVKLDKGRWPANLIHDGSDEVVGMFPTTAPSKAGKRNAPKTGGTFGDYAGDDAERLGHSDNGGSVARFFYSAKASKADRNGSKHPTVKPIALMAWLARLITPPQGTILDPFAGSGTTGAAARQEGFSAILCEREAEYVADIKRRFGAGAVRWRQDRPDVRAAWAELQTRLRERAAV